MNNIDVWCPYCDKGQEINHDDGYGYGEDGLYQQECINCEKTFVYTTYTTYSYEAMKADCLNGSEHDYKPTFTIPNAFTRMRCSMCEAERDLTPEERIRLGIPTKEEYFKEVDARIEAKKEENRKIENLLTKPTKDSSKSEEGEGEL